MFLNLSFSSFFLDIAFNENILDMLYTVSVDCWYHKPHPISLDDVIFRRFQGWSSKLVISSAVSYEDNILRQLSYSTWNFNINNFLGIIIRTSVANISWYFVSQLSTELFWQSDTRHIYSQIILKWEDFSYSLFFSVT